MANYVLSDTLIYTTDKLTLSIGELQHRVCSCEASINKIMEKLENLSMDFSDLKCQIAGEFSELRADLDALTVNLNEKCDLEILEQNDSNELKYIDLDEVNKEKGFWDLYDENWWNK